MTDKTDVDRNQPCGPGEFQCQPQPGQPKNLCIELRSVGDGVPDCPDGSDECPDPMRQFRCKCGLPLCIDRQQVMDGRINCEDGSDEGLDNSMLGCQSFNNDLTLNGKFYF